MNIFIFVHSRQWLEFQEGFFKLMLAKFCNQFTQKFKFIFSIYLFCNGHLKFPSSTLPLQSKSFSEICVYNSELQTTIEYSLYIQALF